MHIEVFQWASCHINLYMQCRTRLINLTHSLLERGSFTYSFSFLSTSPHYINFLESGPLTRPNHCIMNTHTLHKTVTAHWAGAFRGLLNVLQLHVPRVYMCAIQSFSFLPSPFLSLACVQKISFIEKYLMPDYFYVDKLREKIGDQHFK